MLGDGVTGGASSRATDNACSWLARGFPHQCSRSTFTVQYLPRNVAPECGLRGVTTGTAVASPSPHTHKHTHIDQTQLPSVGIEFPDECKMKDVVSAP